jgi:hypothetical protein
MGVTTMSLEKELELADLLFEMAKKSFRAARERGLNVSPIDVLEAIITLAVLKGENLDKDTSKEN